MDDARNLAPNWTHRRIADFCDIFSGGTPPKSEPEYWHGSIPWASGKDLKSPSLSDTIDHVSQEGVKAGSRMAPTDSVLLLVRGMGLAKDLPVSVIEKPMAFNQDLKALVPRNGLPGAFLRAAIYTAKDRLLSRIVPSAHGTMTLNLDDIENFAVAVPNDLSEARVISRVIGLHLNLLDTERDAHVAATALKRAAMRELFTRGLRDEEQKETEIGPIPESWELLPFEHARERLQYGTSNRCTLSEARYPVLRIPNIVPARVKTDELKYCDMPDAEAARYMLRQGDLLFIRTNGVVERLGSCAVYPGQPANALFASYLIRAQLKLDRVDPKYAAYFFSSPVGTDMIAGRATPAADGKFNLNTGTIDSLLIPLPQTLDEQREIVAILDAIDRKIALHKEKRAVLEALFKSLLHKLMAGEVRVADLNLDALGGAAEAA